MTQDIEKAYRDAFARLKTRKNFVFKEIKDGKATIERVDEICGQRENRPYTFNTPAELETFVNEMNQEEINYQKTIASNEMPYR